MENNNKKLDPQLVEFLHNSGKMPDRYYYQLNGKSAEENYIEQKRKNQARLREMLCGEDYTNLHITSEVRIKR